MEEWFKGLHQVKLTFDFQNKDIPYEQDIHEFGERTSRAGWAAWLSCLMNFLQS